MEFPLAKQERNSTSNLPPPNSSSKNSDKLGGLKKKGAGRR
jgi:hypothetical protein